VIGGGASGDGFERKLEAIAVPFTSLPVDKKGINPLADLRLLWKLYAWYRKEQPDIVHHFTIKPVIYGSIAARLAGVTHIVNTVTGLGYVFTGEKITWLRRLVEFQYRIALWCGHFTFFQNHEDRRLFIERRLVSAENTDVVPGSGVDTNYFTPHTSSNEKGSESPTQLIMISRLLRDKGIYEFVEAARLIRQEFLHVRFYLAGRRDERNPTVVPQSDLDRWKSENIVEWLGEFEDVRQVIARADIVVLPSYYREGTPRSLLEAAAMEKPLISTDNVGCRDVIEDGVNGFLVPVRDAQALFEAIRRLILNPGLCSQMGKAGRAKMIKEFDESVVIKRILNIYLNLLTVHNF
jgi:glycosyltransferase involved in cell wall biosynthesis